MPGLLSTLTTARVLAILRTRDAETAVAAGRVLAEAGLSAMEVSMTTPGASRAIAALAADGLHVGAGTVLTAAEAHEALDAGAAYLVTPGIAAETLAVARDRDVPVLCGALTPTEVGVAASSGATAVKVFPVSALGGAAYLRALRGPYPGVPLVAVGGVAVEDVPSYLAAGALAVGIGSPLVGDGEPAGIARRAARLHTVLSGEPS